MRLCFEDKDACIKLEQTNKQTMEYAEMNNKPKHAIKVFYAHCGNDCSISTDINASCAEIQDYYIGKWFNIGNGGLDKMAMAVKVIIDGIEYNHATHKHISESEHAKNLVLIAERAKLRAAMQTPQVGDMLRVVGGYKRFTHKWDDGIQTTSGEPFADGRNGCCHLTERGHGNYSGGLDPVVAYDLLIDTDEKMQAQFWMFSNDSMQAHNGIYFYIPVRVWEIKQ